MSFLVDNNIKLRGKRDGRFSIVILIGWFVLFVIVFDRVHLDNTSLDTSSQQLEMSRELLHNVESNSHNLEIFSFGKIPVNTATVDLLTTVRGIGPKLANTIVQYRKNHGPLSGAGDLIKIKGIGRKRADQFALIFDFQKI